MKKIVRVTENDIVSIVEKVLLENRRFNVKQNKPYRDKVGGKIYTIQFYDRESDGSKEEKDIEQVSFTINGIKGSENVFGTKTGRQVYGHIHNPEKYKEIIGIKDSAHYDELIDTIRNFLYTHLSGKGDWKLPKLNA